MQRLLRRQLPLPRRSPQRLRSFAPRLAAAAVLLMPHAAPAAIALVSRRLLSACLTTRARRSLRAPFMCSSLPWPPARLLALTARVARRPPTPNTQTLAHPASARVPLPVP